MSQSEKKCLFTMTLIMLLGVALGAAQLNADILWVDEMATVSAMGAADPPYSPLRIIESIVQYIPDHVPLYYIVGAEWAQLVGWSQVPLRYLSLLAGVLAIAWLYRFSADVFNRRTACLAAFLFATSGIVIIYFHEMRNYTLWILLCLIHFWLYWRLEDGQKAGKSAWILFVITTSALLYTHPFSPFVLLGLGVHHLLFVAKDRRWLRVAFAWAAGVLIFLPYIPLLVIGFNKETSSASVQSRALSASELIPHLANVLANGVDLLWLPIILFGAWTLWRKRTPALLRLLTVFACVTLALLLFNEVFPFLSTRRLRYFLVALTFALILFAHFLSSIPRWHLLVPLFALAWAVGGYNIYRLAEYWQYAGHHSLLSPHPPFHRLADALQQHTREHDALLGFTPSNWLNGGLRFGFSTVDYYSRAVLGLHGAFVWTGLEGSELQEDLDNRVDDHPYLLFAYEPQNIPDNFDEAHELILRDYAPCEVVVDTEQLFVQRYHYRTLTCDREYQPVHYDNGIRIVDKFADYSAAEKTVRVVTGWEVANEEQLYKYNVSIQIITPDWQLARQAGDRHLYDDILKWYVAEISTADLAPGDYRVVVIVYNRDESGAKVSGIDLTTGEVGAILPILHFTIEA